jgi:hypothetical protein
MFHLKPNEPPKHPEPKLQLFLRPKPLEKTYKKRAIDSPGDAERRDSEREAKTIKFHAAL